MELDPQEPKGRSTATTLLVVAATYLGALAIVAYPLGFATFWVLVWREHTGDAAIALYAASLVPVPIVIAKSFAVLGTSLFIIAGASAFAASAVNSYHVVSAYREHFEEQLSNRLARWFLLSKGWRVAHFIIGLSVAVSLPTDLLGFIHLDSGTDVLYYGCAMLVACGGAVLGMLVVIERREEYSAGYTLSTTAVTVMVGSAALASLLLVPTLPAELPVVRFSEGKVKDATLLSHADGYWYVVDDSDAGVMALPDDTVGTVTVSEAPESAS